MKCSIMLHFIRVYTVYYDYKAFRDQNTSYIGNSASDPLKYTMDSPVLIVSICMGKSIRIQRVNNKYNNINFFALTLTNSLDQARQNIEYLDTLKQIFKKVK